MFEHLRPALVMTVLFTALTGILYPLAITGIGQAAFPKQANGSLIEKDGKIVGSELVGQAFTSDKYFQTRPSAAGADGYDGASSSGSNLGPISQKLLDRVSADVERIKTQGLTGAIPVDAVTASGSGLDPHITPENALMQAPRIAKTRKVQETRIKTLITQYIEKPSLGVFGEPRVNVLRLNLALDALQP